MKNTIALLGGEGFFQYPEPLEASRSTVGVLSKSRTMSRKVWKKKKAKLRMTEKSRQINR